MPPTNDDPLRTTEHNSAPEPQGPSILTTDFPPDAEAGATQPFLADPNLTASVAPTPPTADVLPTAAGRYTLGAEIARGGMAAVGRAVDTVFGRDVAVKVLLADPAERPHLAQRFLEEARITGLLQHPGVPPVHDLGALPDGRPFLAMQLIEGHTFAELLKERRAGEASGHGSANDLPLFLRVFEQVCQTVAFAHSKGIIHRDLKPANVMVGAFGEVQVMDWGLAKSKDEGRRRKDEEKPGASSDSSFLLPLSSLFLPPSSLTQAGSILGTPSYMPPEQARGEIDRIDARADVFTLGGILCEVLTGKPPFTGANAAEVLAQAQAGRVGGTFSRLEACGADAELVRMAKQYLAPEAHERPADAGEVARAAAAHRSGVEERLRQAEVERAAATAKAVEQRKRRRIQVVFGEAIATGHVSGN